MKSEPHLFDKFSPIVPHSHRQDSHLSQNYMQQSAFHCDQSIQNREIWNYDYFTSNNVNYSWEDFELD